MPVSKNELLAALGMLSRMKLSHGCDAWLMYQTRS